MRKASTKQRGSHSAAAAAAAQRQARKKLGSTEVGSSQRQNGLHDVQSPAVSLALNSSSSAMVQRKLVDSLQQSPHSIAQLKKSLSLQSKEDGKIPQKKAEVSQLAGEEEEMLQGKFETAQLVEEEEMLQGKFETAQLMDEEELVQGKFETAQLEEAASAANANKTGLPDNLKSGIENMSGMSVDDVRVHYNSAKPAQLNAHAYAQGKDIHVASGQEKHLPHEAWHIVQQAQGRVVPTAQMNGGVQINDDKSLETEADVQGAKAMQFKFEHGRQKSAN
jgi:hypothetical protein